jgi:putative sterol carrier protein
MVDVGADRLGELDPRKVGRQEFADLLDAADTAAGTDEPVDLSALDPHTFAVLMARASKDQIGEVMARPALRERVLAEVFRRMSDHFRADKAGSLAAVIRWRIGDRPDGDYDRFESVIEDGACVAHRGAEREPRVTITLGGVDFLKLVSGNANPVPMFFTGKLKVKGDLGLAATLLPLFDIPKV